MASNGTVTATSMMAVIFMLLSVSCTRFSGNGFSSEWEQYPDSRWVGPDLWANRLADWEIRNGRLTCLSDLPLRTVHLMTRRAGPEEGNLITLVNIRKESGTANGLSAGGGSNGVGSSSYGNNEPGSRNSDGRDRCRICYSITCKRQYLSQKVVPPATGQKP